MSAIEVAMKLAGIETTYVRGNTLTQNIEGENGMIQEQSSKEARGRVTVCSIEDSTPFLNDNCNLPYNGTELKQTSRETTCIQEHPQSIPHVSYNKVSEHVNNERGDAELIPQTSYNNCAGNSNTVTLDITSGVSAIATHTEAIVVQTAANSFDRNGPHECFGTGVDDSASYRFALQQSTPDNKLFEGDHYAISSNAVTSFISAVSEPLFGKEFHPKATTAILNAVYCDTPQTFSDTVLKPDESDVIDPKIWRTHQIDDHFEMCCENTNKQNSVCIQPSTQPNTLLEESHVELLCKDIIQSKNTREGKTTCIEESSPKEILSIFPFMCSLCFVTFNCIDTFYHHFQAHSQVTDSCFHICGDFNGDQSSTTSTCGKYVCSICWKTFPSLCCLEKHMVNAENVDFVYDSVDMLASSKISDTDTLGKNVHNTTITNTKADITNKREEKEDKVTVVACINGDEIKGDPNQDNDATEASPDTSEGVTGLKDVKANNTSTYDKRRKYESDKINGNSELYERNDIEYKINANTVEQFIEDTGKASGYDKRLETHSTGADMKRAKSTRVEFSGNFKKSQKATNAKTKGFLNECVPLDANVSRQNCPSKMNVQNECVGRVACEMCGKMIKKKSIQMHKIHHSDERPFDCERCGQGFKTRFQLKAHTKCDTSRSRYRCDTCGKDFVTFHHMTNHAKIHTNDRKFECPQCPMTFTTKYILSQHLRRHSDEKPHQCSVCGKSFKRPDGLSAHARTHSGLKDFACSTCGKCFGSRTHLKRHEITHAEIKPYICDVCGRGFVQFSALRIHMRTHGVHVQPKGHGLKF